MSSPGDSNRLWFGDFELDLAAYALRREGRVIKLGRQPMDLLILLVKRPRQLVSRQEIIDRLWGKDVFVDVDTGINTAISKVRQALGDAADAPAYVETVSGRGYRFIADVVSVADRAAPAADASPAAPAAEPAEATIAATPADAIAGVPATLAPSTSRRRPLPAAVAMAVATLAIAAIGMGLIVWRVTGHGTGAPMPSPITLTVLPFESLGGSAEYEYLAAGLTEETSASLAQIDPERLRVKGRALHYRGTTKSAAEIGQELAVDYLVASTIRTEGGRVRVTATLLRVRDQEHLWSHTYEREPASLLGLQQELSIAIAQQVRIRLSSETVHAAGVRHTHDAGAYDAYLRGRDLERRRTAATNGSAIREYERALSLDPNYALAWARLSSTFAASTLNGDASPRDVGPRARDAAARAIGLQPQLAEAQAAAGYVAWLLDWNWPAAERAFRQSTQIDPNSGVAWRMLGHALSQSGQRTEAEAALRRARELEPLDPTMLALSSQVAFQARQLGPAVEHARRAILMDPDFWVGHMQLGQAYAQQGDTDLALEALADAARLSGRNSKAESLRGYVLAQRGQISQARTVLRALETEARDRYVPPYAVALIHAGLGERDEAFAWLERAYAAHDVHLIYLGVDAKWDALRDDPRFRDLLGRCGFPLVPAR
jgi:DNA-binding winged helix-turn-helix (wHTH) protein/TolB-like protein/Flp pilus assembly protein TadD